MKARGFTLIEVLVAVAIAALVLMSVMQSFSVGLATITRARDATQAMLIAESTLEMVGSAIPVRAGVQIDDVDGFRRTLRLSPLDGAQPSSARPGYALAAYRVSVAVAWRSGLRARSVELSSVRLAGGP